MPDDDFTPALYADLLARHTPRPGLKTFAEFAPTVRIVGIINYKDMVIVATNKEIYKIWEGKLQRVKFETVE